MTAAPEPGRCRSCRRRLRDPVSLAAGRGPKCRRAAAGSPSGGLRIRRPPRTDQPDVIPGQAELPLRPIQPTLWSL
ncbi:DUF6011 domain-containing protein [Streptomyces sp. H27-D2]|uniref:DUF6011 domain-containing protein n=1 Tax=Streptomyces sp. H27-D2 TaxID=3046304 RepID=UPI003FA7A415